MKAANLKNLCLNNAPLAIISLLLGYSFWYIASYNQTVTLQLDVPLCFSTLPANITVHAPEKITITLSGPRVDLYSIEEKTVAAHVNVNKLLPGKHGIILTEQHLFLPKSVALTNYKPANLFITISANNPV